MTAYADLVAGLGPHELVPGALGEIEYMAINSAAYAEQLARTRQGVDYIQVHGSAFTGRAADVYGAARLAHLESLKVAALAFEVAAGALASYAVALRDARVQAAAARKGFDAAQRALASCGTGTAPVIGSAGVLRPLPPAASASPGIPVTVQGAVAQLEAARANVRAAGKAAAKALNEAATWSPAAIDADGGFHLPSPGNVVDSLENLPHDMVTGPYHVMHGYVSTLARSFAGIGLAQYAGEHGMPGPGDDPQMAAGHAELEKGAFDTVGLLGLGDGAAGLAALGVRSLTAPTIEVLAASAPDALPRLLPLTDPEAIPAAVTRGWPRRIANNGQGWVWQEPGAAGNSLSVRVMDPNARYPYGRVRFYNEHNQPIGLDGKPGDLDRTHIARRIDGSFPVPEGW